MTVAHSLPIIDASARRSALVREPLGADRAAELGRAFKALGEPARLRLLSLIAAHERGEACVCDMTDPLGLSQPTVSHHLRVLREAGLITGERRGTWVHYRIVPGALDRLGSVLGDVATEAGDALRPGC